MRGGSQDLSHTLDHPLLRVGPRCNAQFCLNSLLLVCHTCILEACKIRSFLRLCVFTVHMQGASDCVRYLIRALPSLSSRTVTVSEKSTVSRKSLTWTVVSEVRKQRFTNSGLCDTSQCQAFWPTASGSPRIRAPSRARALTASIGTY